MLSLLIQKELKNILLSPKFVATFLVCSVLILISVYIGINEYQNAIVQYDASQEIARQDISQATSWGRVRNLLHREPTPMQILFQVSILMSGDYQQLLTIRISNWFVVHIRMKLYLPYLES